MGCDVFLENSLGSQGFYGFAFLQFESEFLPFPSGHAATVFSLAEALSYSFAKLRLFLFSFAILVATSRILITSQYLSAFIMGLLSASSLCTSYGNFS